MARAGPKTWSYKAGKRPNTVTVAERTPGGPIYARAWDRTREKYVRVSLGHRDRKAADVVSAIPNDVTYAIIDSHTIGGIKRSLDIRLNRKVPEDVLRAIALKLRSMDPRQFDRTFISYYLEGMQVGAGAWATTHFNPALEVRILGLSIEDEERLTREPDS